jgi:hypothetical protein
LIARLRGFSASADLGERQVDHGANAYATSPEAGSKLNAVNARI